MLGGVGGGRWDAHKLEPLTIDKVSSLEGPHANMSWSEKELKIWEEGRHLLT